MAAYVKNISMPSAARLQHPRQHRPPRLPRPQAPEPSRRGASFRETIGGRSMAKLIVSGAAGRMGRLLVSMIATDSQCSLAGALEAETAGVTGRDAGELAG